MIKKEEQITIVKAVVSASNIVVGDCYLNKLLIAEELLRKYIADNYNVRLNILTFHDEIRFKFEEINKG